MYTHDRGFWNVLRDLDRIFDAVGSGQRSYPLFGSATPALNVSGNDDALIVTSEIPGVQPADLGITVHGDTLTVSGKRVLAPAQDKQPERSITFERSLQLPYRVDGERTEARCRDGVLTITLHRLASEKPRAISVSAT